MPYAIVGDGRSVESRHEAGSGVLRSVHGKGYFWGRIWGAPLYGVRVRQRRDAALFPNYFGQTCSLLRHAAQSKFVLVD